MKEKLIKRNEEIRAAFPSLYSNKWVEDAADKGWKELVEELTKIDPKLGEVARRDEGLNVFAIIYYTAFEDALNTFFMQCLDDSITSVKLAMDEFHKVTAEMQQDFEKFSGTKL